VKSRAGWFFFFALSLLFISKPALSARSATVDVEGVELKEGPGAGFKTLEKLPKGTPLAAGNQPIEGFFKVRTGAGTIGFVQADLLVLQPPEAPAPEEPSPAPRPRSQRQRQAQQPRFRRYKVKAIGGYDFFSVADVNTLFSANVLQFGYSAGVEFEYVVLPEWALVFRAERLFKSVLARDSNTLKSFDMSISSNPLMLGGEYTVSDNGIFSAHVALLGGIGLVTDLRATDLTDNPPNVTDMSALAYTGLLKADVTYSINKTWTVLAEAGYRYLATPQITPADSQNGSQIFKDPKTQAYIPLSLSLSGPFIGVGVGAAF
jgi:hypothetical protein